MDVMNFFLKNQLSNEGMGFLSRQVLKFFG